MLQMRWCLSSSHQASFTDRTPPWWSMPSGLGTSHLAVAGTCELIQEASWCCYRLLPVCFLHCRCPAQVKKSSSDKIGPRYSLYRVLLMLLSCDVVDLLFLNARLTLVTLTLERSSRAGETGLALGSFQQRLASGWLAWDRCPYSSTLYTYICICIIHIYIYYI